jgi:WD40 repeat protein
MEFFVQFKLQSCFQRQGRQRSNWRLLSTLLTLTLFIFCSSTLASAQTQPQQTYWLGHSTGTEYVFDVPLPADLAAMITASGAKYAKFKSFPKFSTEVIDGETYSFVTTGIAWDGDKIDDGHIAFQREGTVQGSWWFNLDGDSAEWKALVPQVKAQVTKNGNWSYALLYVLISPDADVPTVRVPVPETTQAQVKMNELGATTKAGLFYPTVKVPMDLEAFRTQMLAYGNAGRQDPDFRKTNGSKTAADLSGDTVVTLGGKEKVFKQSATPPYFNDLVLNDKLNQAAQFQAEYIASINKLGHDGPRAYLDPKTGTRVNMFDLGDRAKYFGYTTGVVEAAGQGGLGDYPHSWMAGETHFRPWFNVDGVYTEIGYGAAMASNGKWYFVAVPNRYADGVTPTPTATEAATATPAPATPTPATTKAAASATPTPVATKAAAVPQENVFPLSTGHTIVQGQKYDSPSGDHYLIFQPDGNVVVYTAADQYVWGLQSETDKYAEAQSVKMQEDGNFVIRGANDEYIWSALDENPDASAFLTLTPQGVLQLVSGDTGKILWASDGDLAAATPAATATSAPTAPPELVWQATLVITDAHSYGLSPWSPWSPDGSKLVAASDDNTVRVWDATSSANLATLTGHTDHVRSPAWSPDGSKIAAASWDETVRVWDATSGANLATLTGHKFRVDDVAWSPDGGKLASASGFADGIIKVWDATTGAELATLTGHTHYLQSLAWSPDGSKLASASSDQTVRIWNIATGANQSTITNQNSLGTQVVWSSDGYWVASGFENDGAVGVWDAATGESKYTLTGHTDAVGSLAWRGCNTIFGGLCLLASGSDDGTIQLWDVNALDKKLATLTGHTSLVQSLAWSPDGSKLASGDWEGTIRVWDAATGASLATLTGHTSSVASLAWSPDGSKLASEGDGTVRVWAEVAK